MEQIIDCLCPVDGCISDEGYASPLEVAPDSGTDRLGQLETGNPIDQQSTRSRFGVENGDLMAKASELFCTG